MSALQQLLFVPTQNKACDLVLRQPQLLTYSSETLMSRLEALRRTLRVSSDASLMVVMRHPNVLCLRPQLVQVCLKVFHMYESSCLMQLGSYGMMCPREGQWPKGIIG